MKEFFLENWKFLLEILLLIVSVIIVLVKKKTVIKVPDNISEDVIFLIPSWINEAEEVYGSGYGDKKLSYVVKKAVSYVSSKLEISVSDIPVSFIGTISTYIEDVLSTPSKKKGE